MNSSLPHYRDAAEAAQPDSWNDSLVLPGEPQGPRSFRVDFEAISAGQIPLQPVRYRAQQKQGGLVRGIGKCRSKCVRGKINALMASLPYLCLFNEQAGKGRFGIGLRFTMAQIVYSEGSVAVDLKGLLVSLPLVNARRFHHLAAVGMEKIGYVVKREFLVPNRGDGRRGKIDIVGRRNNEIVAIELDHVSARAKSLYKIKHFRPATARLVVCREVGGV